MIVVSSDNYNTYKSFVNGYWFENKVIDCGSIECNKTFDLSKEEVKNQHIQYNDDSQSSFAKNKYVNVRKYSANHSKHLILSTIN